MAKKAIFSNNGAIVGRCKLGRLLVHTMVNTLVQVLMQDASFFTTGRYRRVYLCSWPYAVATDHNPDFPVILPKLVVSPFSLFFSQITPTCERRMNNVVFKSSPDVKAPLRRHRPAFHDNAQGSPGDWHNTKCTSIQNMLVTISIDGKCQEKWGRPYFMSN